MTAEPASDGVFRYYWTEHEECEYCHGPFNSVDEAREDAISIAYDTTYGPEPEATIFIVRADKVVPAAPDFDLEALMEAFMEKNEECWGEDGWDGLRGDAVKALDALQAMLKATFTAWAAQHREQINTFIFGQVETVETYTFPPMTAAEMYERFVRQFMNTTGLSRAAVEAAVAGDDSAVRAAIQARAKRHTIVEAVWDETRDAYIELQRDEAEAASGADYPKD